MTTMKTSATKKIECLKHTPWSYFTKAVLAGFFIDMAMIYSNVVNQIFSGSIIPEVGRFLGALVFSIAVLLIVLVGGELFTGNNLVMGYGLYTGSVKPSDVASVWVVSWFGNLVGCVLMALIFVLAGASGTAPYCATMMASKLSTPGVQLFFRAILCNFFVCCGVCCGIRLKSEAGKILMIMMCISGFVISGFEHSVANMGNFAVAMMILPGIPFEVVIKNLAIVTLGNIIGGAVLLALPLWLSEKGSDQGADTDNSSDYPTGDRLEDLK